MLVVKRLILGRKPRDVCVQAASNLRPKPRRFEPRSSGPRMTPMARMLESGLFSSVCPVKSVVNVILVFDSRGELCLALGHRGVVVVNLTRAAPQGDRSRALRARSGEQETVEQGSERNTIDRRRKDSRPRTACPSAPRVVRQSRYTSRRLPSNGITDRQRFFATTLLAACNSISTIRASKTFAPSQSYSLSLPALPSRETSRSLPSSP